jgi:hypothetical protein
MSWPRFIFILFVMRQNRDLYNNLEGVTVIAYGRQNTENSERQQKSKNKLPVVCPTLASSCANELLSLRVQEICSHGIMSTCVGPLQRTY